MERKRRDKRIRHSEKGEKRRLWQASDITLSADHGMSRQRVPITAIIMIVEMKQEEMKKEKGHREKDK